MAREPHPVPARVPGELGHGDAEQREAQAEQGAGVLQQHGGQLGLASLAGCSACSDFDPRDLFASRSAVRNDQDSSTIAMNRTV